MNYVYLALVFVAFAVIHCAAGGTRLVNALPAYELLAATGLLTIFSMRRNKASPNFWCLLSLGIFAGYVLIRALFSPMAYLARPDIFLMLASTLVYLLTAFYMTDTRDRLIFLCCLFGLALLHVLVGLVQFGKGGDFMLFGFERAGAGRRASGLFVNPNHFAGFLEMIGPMALSFLWWSRLSVPQKIGLSQLTLACYAGVALSGSRGGYLSSICGLAAFALLTLWTVKKTDPRRFPTVTLVIGAGIGLFIIGVMIMQSSALLNYRIEQIGTEDVRFYNWQATLDQFESKAIAGTGAGTHLYFGRLLRRPQIQADPVHAHNDYLELLAEYGILGGAAMLLFVCAHFFNGVKNATAIANERLAKFYIPRSNGFAFQIGALSALAAMAFHSFLDFNLHIPANALMVAFLFGVLSNPGVEGHQPPQTAMSRFFRFALPPFAALAALMATMRAPGEYYGEKARVALRNHEFFAALDFAARAISHDKKNPNYYFITGEADRALAFAHRLNADTHRDYLEKAVLAYQSGLAIFPNEENLLVRMAQALDGLKKYDEAEEFYIRALDVDPNQALIHMLYGRHLEAVGRKMDAEAQYEMAHDYTDAQTSRAHTFELDKP